MQQSVFPNLEEFRIHVPSESCYRFRVTFDFECYFDNAYLLANSPKVRWLARHGILSVSICSNVPWFTEPCCFVNEGDSSQLLDLFMVYLKGDMNKLE